MLSVRLNIIFVLLLAISGISLIEYYKNRHIFSESFPACEQHLSKAGCEKIGQMLIVGFGGLKQDKDGKILWEDSKGTVFNEHSNIAKIIKQYHIGGVILFTSPFRNVKTGTFIRDRNIQNPKQVRSLNQALIQYSEQVRAESHLSPAPLLITIDQEGGVVDRLPCHLGFPLRTYIPQALGANEERVFDNNDEKLKALAETEQYANRMADELIDNQFNCNLIPCLDININPLNAIIGGKGRSFSGNPEIVFDQAQVFVKVFNDKGIITALKHFPGHGSSQKDTHIGLVDVTESYQKEKEQMPYQKFIKNGYQDLIMTTHVINGQIDKTQCKMGSSEDSSTWCPGTMSYATITGLLRQEMGFKGVIVSDDMTMGAIANEYPLDVAFEKAIKAGVDMFIISNNTEDNTGLVINTIAKLVKDGRVSEAEIDRAYQNIIELKKRHFKF